jgi:hypothetical protein
MEKFLSIPVTNEQRNLISATGVVLVSQNSTTTVHVHYKASLASDVVTITHATAPAGDESMRDAVQDAIVAALGTSWTNVVYEMTNLPFAVSAITVA